VKYQLSEAAIRFAAQERKMQALTTAQRVKLDRARAMVAVRQRDYDVAQDNLQITRAYLEEVEEELGLN
jgi:hypothetical protein